MSQRIDSFGEGVLECVEDLNEILPLLAKRYSPKVIMAALVEHVGSALCILMARKVIDGVQTRRVIARIRNAAFLRAHMAASPQPDGE